MPPASLPLATRWIARIGHTLELKQGKWKGLQRLYVRIKDTGGGQMLWLSDDPCQRVDQIMAAFTQAGLVEDDLGEEFKETLLNGPRRAR